MFCPECKTEYREGFIECADCKVQLVDTLELENENNEQKLEVYENVKFKSVLSTYNVGDIALIKGLLDDAGITYFFQGENISHIRGAIEPSILKVKEEEVSEVKELLKDFDLKIYTFQ